MPDPDAPDEREIMERLKQDACQAQIKRHLKAIARLYQGSPTLVLVVHWPRLDFSPITTVLPGTSEEVSNG